MIVDSQTAGGSTELARLFHEARNGSEDAARQIVTRYSSAIRRTVRHLLHHKLRPKFDTCDFEQAVWASFFAESTQLEGFQSSSDVLKYLVRVARNKVVEEYRRRLLGRKYNVNREHSLDDPDGESPIDHSQATPSQNAIAGEEMARLLAAHPDTQQRLLRRRIEGKTYREMATDERVHERTARRTVQRLRLKWRETT